MCSAGRVELRFDRCDAGGVDPGESVHGGDEVGHGRFDPGNGLDDTLMLVGQRPVPNRFVMEDAVAQLAHFIEPLGEVSSCSPVLPGSQQFSDRFMAQPDPSADLSLANSLPAKTNACFDGVGNTAHRAANIVDQPSAHQTHGTFT